MIEGKILVDIDKLTKYWAKTKGILFEQLKY